MMEFAKKEIVITFTSDGQLSVHGPLAEKMLCYGMLELAKDVIRAHNTTPPTGLSVARMDFKPNGT